MRQRFIQSFSTSGDVQTAIDDQALGKPYVAYLEDEQKIDWDSKSSSIVYSAMPLTFEIISGGTITWKRTGASSEARTIQYKKNNNEWVSITSKNISAPTIQVQPGDIVYLKGNNTTYCPSQPNIFESNSCKFKAYGNILSMIYGDDFINYTEFPSDTNKTFQNLFRNNTGIIDTSNLIVPQNVKISCYKGMFSGCTSLTTAPELLASTLNEGSYQNMFYGCSSLNYIKCLATDISAVDCVTSWLNGVSATGTFVKHPNATWPEGASGIPAGWTVIDADI